MLKDLKLTSLLKDKPSIWFSVIFLAFFLTMLIVEFINGRLWLNDLRVFYQAANAWLNETEVYNIPFGEDTGIFKYSPFTLLLFVPIALLPYSLAIFIYFLFLVISLWLLLLALNQYVQDTLMNQKGNSILLFPVFIAIVVHAVRELHLGNTNIILLLLCFSSYYLSQKNRPTLSGILLAVVFFTKPYFGLLLLPLWYFGYRKTIIATIISCTIALIIPVVLSGFDRGTNLYLDWLKSMQDHSVLLQSFQTIPSFISRFSEIEFSGGQSILLFSLSSFLLFGWYYLLKMKDLYSPNKNLPFYVFFFGIIAMAPNFLITDTQHFLFSLPLITLLAHHVFIRRRGIEVILLVLILSGYGMNINDLWGTETSIFIDEMGILGLSNLGILVWCFYLVYHTKRAPISVSSL